MYTPDFLQDLDPDPPHTYGMLLYANNRFALSGEPVLLEFAKRLFPGSHFSRSGGGVLTFRADNREFQNLHWLLLRYPVQIECREEFENAKDTSLNRIRTRATQGDITPTCPPGNFLGNLFPYQEEAVTFLCTNKRALLGDTMGLGKTWSALGAIATTGQYPVLIVVPSAVQIQWQRVIGALFDIPCSYEQKLFDDAIDVAEKRGRSLAPILQGRTPYEIPDTPFTLVHYGLLSYWGEVIRNKSYPVVIFDEIQELRHPETKKYSQASLISGDAKHVYGLSGTPVFNYGEDIWSVMNILDFNCLGSQESFRREWCTGYGERVVEHPKALNGYLIREGLFMRRRYSDVGIAVPRVARTLKDVDYDGDVYEDLIAEARRKSTEWETATFTQKGKLSREIETMTRLASGVSKASFVAQFVASLIEGGEVPLVFAWHHDVHNVLRDALSAYNPVLITGKQTQTQKDCSVRALMYGNSKVAIMSLRSASGLDGLQSRATCTVFAELDWAPAVFHQAETRIARIGADADMVVPSFYCISRTGYDEVMLDVLGLKQGQFVGIVGDEPEDFEEKRAMDDLALKRIQKIIDKLKKAA